MSENLGSCCVCESTVAVHSLIMLPQKAPMPGRGWGCVVCDLPADGALAVVCDGCAHTFAADVVPLLQFACRGYPGTDGRVPITDLTGAHDHDFAKHPPEDRPADPLEPRRLEPKPGFDWTRVRWSGPLAPVDETCSYCGAAIPDEHVPLRLWNETHWAAVFCHGCMERWWGMEHLEDAADDPFIGSEADRAEWHDDDEIE